MKNLIRVAQEMMVNMQSWSLFLNKGSSVTLSYQLDTDGLFLVALQGSTWPGGIRL